MMREETERQDEGAEASGREGGPGDATTVGTEPGEGLEDETVEELELVEDEVAALREELDRMNDRHLRLAAEFDNYRKRTDRDRESMGARLQLTLISPLLDVVDDMERVAASGEESGARALLDGIRLVEKKLHNVLGAAGLEPIDAEGAQFDPGVMEAMMTVPTDDPRLDDHVADVFQRGYRLGDILVRPARVRVLKYEGEGSA
jgi:molecular chaperone GrpE